FQPLKGKDGRANPPFGRYTLTSITFQPLKGKDGRANTSYPQWEMTRIIKP
ncbi:MAG: hypothetical protein GY803_32290, partial [Chloroflexi bacterium]|nr:hypothetical protein [Chloroflexota bacterium]